MVAQRVYQDPGCWVSGVAYRPWSYTFAASELSIFDDGVGDLTGIQTSPSTIRLGSLTLEGTAAPELGTLFLMASGLLGMAFVRRREALDV